MIQITSLTIQLKNNFTYLLKDVSFVINDNDKVAIIGEESSGKSTLLNFIYNPEYISQYATYKGNIAKTGSFYIFRQPFSYDKDETVSSYLLKENFYDFFPKDANYYKLELGIDDDLLYSNEKLENLSGGEKTKLRLLIAFLNSCSTLLLDEPSKDLDYVARLKLAKLIKEYRGTVVLISHDTILLKEATSSTISLERDYNKKESILSFKNLDYKSFVDNTSMEREAKENKILEIQREIKIRNDKKKKIESSVQEEMDKTTSRDPFKGMILKHKMKAIKSMEKRYIKEDSLRETQIPHISEQFTFNFAFSPQNLKPITIDIDTLVVEDKVLSSNLHLMVASGEKICFVGPSGIGKTTLLRNIYNKLSKGDNTLFYLPQNYEEIYDLNLSALDILNPSGDKEIRDEISRALVYFHIAYEDITIPLKNLSQGELAKVFLSYAAIYPHSILILDEPTRSLSPLQIPSFIKAIKEFKGTIIMVSHEIDLWDISTRCLSFNKEGFLDFKY